jgi:hypothetical protein
MALRVVLLRRRNTSGVGGKAEVQSGTLEATRLTQSSRLPIQS